MPNYLFPNVALSKGKLRKAIIDTKSSLSMGASSSAQSEVDIPVYGDLVAMEVIVTNTTAGTLTGAKTIDYAVKQVAVKDKSGRPIWSSIRGIDLKQLDRMLNIGLARTPATASASSATFRTLIPLNIERKDMPARVQVTMAPYSDMATSGATGGTLTYDIIGWYVDESQLKYTQRVSRISQSIVSGLNRFAPNLPKNVTIEHLLGSVGTESNITDITFSSDGSAELDELRLTDVTAIEDVRYVSGHQTGSFSMFVSPFLSTERSVLDITGAGSDTIEWYVVTAD